MQQNQPVLEKKHIVYGFLGLIAIVFIVLIAMSITTVDAGHVGVKKVFGKVSEDVLEEGLHFIAPWVSVVQIDTRIQNINISAMAGEANAAISKDTQTVGFTVDLAYNVDSISAWMLIKYVGESNKQVASVILEPSAWQGVKEVISQYGIEEIPNQREMIRIEIGERMKILVEERLKKRFENALNSIRINQVTLRNIDYAEEYEQAITEKQVEAQRALQEENKLRRFQIEQKQAVAKAEQQARADVIKANGEAIAYLTKLGAEVTAYAKLRAVGFPPSTYNFLETWDGKLPNVLAGSEMLQGLIIPADKLEKMDEKDIKLLLGDIEKQKEILAKEMERLSKEALKSTSNEKKDIMGENSTSDSSE